MANTLNLFRGEASLLANAFGVGFIDWLGLCCINLNDSNSIAPIQRMASSTLLIVGSNADSNAVHGEQMFVTHAAARKGGNSPVLKWLPIRE